MPITSGEDGDGGERRGPRQGRGREAAVTKERDGQRKRHRQRGRGQRKHDRTQRRFPRPRGGRPPSAGSPFITTERQAAQSRKTAAPRITAASSARAAPVSPGHGKSPGGSRPRRPPFDAGSRRRPAPSHQGRSPPGFNPSSARTPEVEIPEAGKRLVDRQLVPWSRTGPPPEDQRDGISSLVQMRKDQQRRPRQGTRAGGIERSNWALMSAW